jgi:phenylacetate-coenzyme A ligase PaaK-like adenylate-forming protein
MKGRRKELIRAELHSQIRETWNLEHIHSEYGMTELLSQAWMKKENRFECPPWMKIQIRDASDPFTLLPENRNGGIQIVDLANIDSCSFISTSDLGKIYEDSSFEVLGRFDNSDIRGCNLLVDA